jgi:hypothetical protein
MGHKRTSRHVRVMSVIPLKADIHQRGLHVRFVPIADILQSALHSQNPPECVHVIVREILGEKLG